MKKLNAWQTMDGQVFTDRRKAEHHAEERYGSLLTHLSHQTVRIDKYTQMMDFIEKNLQQFVDLKALKDDIRTQEDETDGE